MTDQPILRTARLTLRPFWLEDGPRVQQLAGAIEVADTTLAIPHPYPDGAAEAWIGTHADAWTSGLSVTYAMVESETHDLVGCIGLSIASQHARAELGYWVGHPYWNRGYCTEAGKALFSLGFGLLKLHRIESRHFVRNAASGRVMQKLGMQREGFQRGAMLKNGRFEDLVLYGIIVSDAAHTTRDNSPNSL